jgi:8-oxo-dGTP pyrophosphatase MutT (NUDIX family)
MSLFNHNVFENVRTRAIVIRDGRILLHPPGCDHVDAWGLPGGGLEPHESLADCIVREVREEMGIGIIPGKVAFLREWVVPRYAGSPMDDIGEGYGFCLEVYFYARPADPLELPRSEKPGQPCAVWVPLAHVCTLRIWPKELKALCSQLSCGRDHAGSPSIVAILEDPSAVLDPAVSIF